MLNFPAKILFVTSPYMKIKVDPQFAVFFWCKLIVSEAFTLNLILGLLQAPFLRRFLVFGRREALQIQRSVNRTSQCRF